MRKGEDFSGICIWHGTFSRTIECSEKVDEEGDETNARAARAWNIEAETTSEEAPRHIGEGEQ